MNALAPLSASLDRTLLRKSATVSILERLCAMLEPTEAQKETARERYEAVGLWLADAHQDLFSESRISSHGSFALGTVIKPLSGLEYDVDLLCRFTALAGRLGPAELKQVLGTRIRENSKYGSILEEMPRCWRLNYSGEFHMDITPSIPNPACPHGGELVPDKKLHGWKPTNPGGYLRLFEARSTLLPTMRVLKSSTVMDSRGTVDPFPEHLGFKGILRRIVQMLKRHRDIYFENADDSLQPISVILTTLAAQAYEFCVGKYVFDSEFDVVLAVVRAMPYFIETYLLHGKPQWRIVNETTKGENFAEKWNLYPERAAAFSEWHSRALTDIERLVKLEGSDRVTESLAHAFGNQPVKQVIKAMAEEINVARSNRTLAVAPKMGVVIGTTVTQRVTQVRSNTFYGGGEARMPWQQSRKLSAAQQYLALRSNPICEGHGVLSRGRLTWTWQAAPSPLGRIYTLRVEFREGDRPEVFVDHPDLVALAEGRKLPHVYGESPTRLCLYVPSSGEWHGDSLIDSTVVPWAVLWLYFFEEWLVSDEWKGGGTHPANGGSDAPNTRQGITAGSGHSKQDGESA